MQQSPYDYFTVSYVNNDAKHWRVLVEGPPNTPYEEGLFTLDIQLNQYPYKCPKICLVTKIFHMNITSKGTICLATTAEWNISSNIVDILNEFYELLMCPAPEDGIRDDAKQLFLSNQDLYNKTAREWTKRFATLISNTDTVSVTASVSKPKDEHSKPKDKEYDFSDEDDSLSVSDSE